MGSNKRKAALCGRWKLGKNCGEVKAYIETLNWNSGVLNINAVNGEYHILLNGSSNHAYLESDIFELLTFIAKIAEGTYGLFYLWNDEAEDGKDNEFRVIVLNRGMIRETSDHYLSPFIPIVEDAMQGQMKSKFCS